MGLLRSYGFWFSAIAAAASASEPCLTWSLCTDETPPPGSAALLCSSLEVPLDYTDIEVGNLTLQLVKFPATKAPSKGSILYNPGGPGGSGKEELVAVGPWLSVMLGGEFDIVSWDPRGTGSTLPFSCFSSDAARDAMAAKIPLASNSSSTALTEEWAARTSFASASACKDQAKESGELVGTAFTARDMMQIVDALGEDGLLRYWGQSYGSIIGMTAAAMFPDRVDRVVVDGIVNPHDYYNGGGSTDLADTDAVFAGFVAGCIASPQLCPLEALASQANSLSQQLYQMLDQLRDSQITIPTNSSASGVNRDAYSLLKEEIFSSLYGPASWPDLAFVLNAILTDNMTEINAIVQDIFDTNNTTFFPNETTNEALYGVWCSDTSLRANDLEAVRPLIDIYYAQSVIAGDLWSSLPLTCAQWQFAAKERVKTDWNVKTRHPLLFIGNSFDPVTPLASARNASAGFGGSQVLVQNGYGHSSFAQPSRCTASHVRSYFENGGLPPAGTICQVDVDTFTNQTFLGAFSSPSGQYSRRAERSLVADSTGENDNELASALWKLSRRWLHRRRHIHA